MKQDEQSLRRVSVEWWNHCRETTRQNLCNKYFGYERLANTLTGREIETIYCNIIDGMIFNNTAIDKNSFES